MANDLSISEFGVTTNTESPLRIRNLSAGLLCNAVEAVQLVVPPTVPVWAATRDVNSFGDGTPLSKTDAGTAVQLREPLARTPGPEPGALLPTRNWGEGSAVASGGKGAAAWQSKKATADNEEAISSSDGNENYDEVGADYEGNNLLLRNA